MEKLPDSKHRTGGRSVELATFPGMHKSWLGSKALGIVNRNEGIKKLVEQSMNETQSLTYNKFKITDTPESQFVSRQSRTIIDDRRSNLLNSSFQLKGLHTVRQTMKHMLETQRHRKMYDRESECLLETVQSVIDRKRQLTQQKTSQSLSFCQNKFDANKEFIAIEENSEFDRFDKNVARLTKFPDHRKKTNLDVNRASFVVGDINVQQEDRRRTQVSFNKTANSFTLHSISGGDKNGKTSDPFGQRDRVVEDIGTLQQRFEQFDFVDQAKIMRIGFNETRAERFMHIYEQNQADLLRKIRKWGHHPVSKSIMLDRVEESPLAVRKEEQNAEQKGQK